MEILENISSFLLTKMFFLNFPFVKKYFNNKCVCTKTIIKAGKMRKNIFVKCFKARVLKTRVGNWRTLPYLLEYSHSSGASPVQFTSQVSPLLITA